MAYVVRTNERAEREFTKLFDDINAVESDAALEWYNRFKEAILSLAHNPDRCPVTPENPRLRHLLYGHKPHVYRVIFRVLEKQQQVEVLHIRHGARRKLKKSEP